MKMIFAYYLRKELDEIWEPIPDGEEGDFVAALESGEVEKHAVAIAESVSALQYVPGRALPRMNGMNLASRAMPIFDNGDRKRGAT